MIRSGSGNENQYDPMSEHDHCFPSENIPCLTCQDKKEAIKSLVGKVNNQDDQITKLRKGGLRQIKLFSIKLTTRSMRVVAMVTVENNDEQ